MSLRPTCLLVSCIFIGISFSHSFAAYEEPAKSTYPAADNTATNIRDRNNRTLTAEDQIRGSTADVELTRKIRQELTSNKYLSTYGHNIKIITLNRTVTLRGPVASRKERAEIVRAARNMPGVKKVHDQLEVSTVTK